MQVHDVGDDERVRQVESTDACHLPGNWYKSENIKVLTVTLVDNGVERCTGQTRRVAFADTLRRAARSTVRIARCRQQTNLDENCSLSLKLIILENELN